MNIHHRATPAIVRLLVAHLARSAPATGLWMTPWPLVIVFVAPLSGRLADRYRILLDLLGTRGAQEALVGAAVAAGLRLLPALLRLTRRSRAGGNPC